MGQVPWTFGKDVMGAQALVFIVYLVRLLRRSGKDERRGETPENAKEIGGEVGRDRKDQTDNGEAVNEAPS
jgi:hypothetical protein